MGKPIDIEQKTELVREWDRSGKTSSEFARSHGVSASALMAWGREIRGPRPVRSLRRQTVSRIEVVELQKDEDRRGARLEITLRGGRRITLFGLWTPAQLAEIARALETNE
jgi:transposase-like protein